MTAEDYILSHISPEPPWLADCFLDTWRYRLYPRMCAGHLQGSILTMLTAMAAPRRVIEIGTYSAYSTMAIAAGLPHGGTVDTVEIDDEHEPFIRRMIARCPFADRIRLHIGDAADIIPAISSEPWDMAFIDANKRCYTDYYQILLPLLRPGGFILADNTLWDGHLYNEAPPSRGGRGGADAQARGILDFNDTVAADPRVTVTILPLRDGLTIIRKNPS